MSSHKNPIRLSIFVLLFLFVLTPLGTAHAQRGAASEQRTSRYFDSIKDQPLLLLNFLKRMPKGGDLHNHLSGAVYAESYIQWAAESGLCVNDTTLALASPPCAQPNVPVSNALTNVVLYRRIIDAWSMQLGEVGTKCP
jgi:adenosine deaminase